MARIDRTTRAALRRLQSVIQSAGGTVLGVVATGSSPRAHGYGYGYGYNPPKRSRRAARKARKAAESTAPPAPAAPRDRVDV